MIDKRKNIWITIIIFVGIVVVLMLYLFRYFQLNSMYPQGSLQVIEAGESVIIDEVEYATVSGKLISANEYAKMVGMTLDEMMLDANAILVVFDVRVQNHSNEEQSIMRLIEGQVVSGYWSNGIDIGVLKEVPSVVGPKEELTVHLATTYNGKKTNIDTLYDECRVRISDWPSRVELVVPIELNEEGE